MICIILFKNLNISNFSFKRNFIKGTAANPFCKFTKELINILKENKIKFDFVNILE